MGAAGTNYSHSATAGQTGIGGAQGSNNILLAGYWLPKLSGPTEVEHEEMEGLPTKFELHQNYPNPFNPQTTIQYDLANESLVTVEIFNVVGRRIRLLMNAQVQGRGSMQLIWDGHDDLGKMVGSGIYLYRITAFSVGSENSRGHILFQDMKKMLFVK